jgi:hypothetical protein
MDETQTRSLDVLTFAMLGAYHSGQGHAAQETRVGAKFRGSLGAARELGMTDALAESDPQWRAIRSMFIAGYMDYLKAGDLYTDEQGNVVRFERRGLKRKEH